MNLLKISKIEKQILLKELIRHTYSMRALIKSSKKSVKKRQKLLLAQKTQIKKKLFGKYLTLFITRLYYLKFSMFQSMKSKRNWRSEERRVGKECRSGWTSYHDKQNNIEYRLMNCNSSRSMAN